MVIFTGTGRCGTKTVAGVFRTSHERKGTLMQRIRQSPAISGNPFSTRLERFDALLEHFQAAGVSLPDMDGFADSSSAYFGFIDALVDIDPAVRIVYLVRDPYTCIPSTIAREGHLNTCWSAHPTPEDPAWEEWADWSPIERAAWIWEFRNVTAWRQLTTIPSKNWWPVKIEDFWNQIGTISHFTGLAPDMEVVKSRTVFGATDKSKLCAADTWTERERERVVEIAHQSMAHFDYGPFAHSSNTSIIGVTTIR